MLTDILAQTRRAIQEADETLSRGNFGAYAALIARESRKRGYSPGEGHAMTVRDVGVGRSVPADPTIDEEVSADERRLAEQYRALCKDAETQLFPAIATVRELFPLLQGSIDCYLSSEEDLRQLEHRSLKEVMVYMIGILNAVPADYHPQTLFPVGKKDPTQTKERYVENSLDGVKELPYQDAVITALKSRQASLNGSWQFVGDIELGDLRCTVNWYPLAGLPEEQGGREQARYENVLARVYQKDGEIVAMGIIALEPPTSSFPNLRRHQS